MRNTNFLRLCAIVSLTMSGAFPEGIRAQVGTQPQMTAAPGACRDKVSITDFKLSGGGMSRTLTLTMRNLCTGTVVPTTISVPWRITVGARTLKSSTISIAPGGTATVTAMWSLEAGTFNFDAIADPDNSLGEPTAAQGNNLPIGIQRTVSSQEYSAAYTAWLANAMDGVSQTPSSPGPGGSNASDACTLGDKIQLVSFTISPANPVRNQEVSLALSVKNHCTTPRTIPWRVLLGTVLLAEGTREVAAGATITITAPWTAAVGTHTINAEIDPNNLTPESPAGRANNRPVTAPIVTVPASN